MCLCTTITSLLALKLEVEPQGEEPQGEEPKGEEPQGEEAKHHMTGTPRRLMSLSWHRPPNLPAGDQFVVDMDRKREPIGFKIVGGSDSKRSHGFIYVAEGSVSKERRKVIRDGDIILQVVRRGRGLVTMVTV